MGFFRTSGGGGGGGDMQALLRLEFEWAGGAVGLNPPTFSGRRQRATENERQVFVFPYHQRFTEHSNPLRILTVGKFCARKESGMLQAPRVAPTRTGGGKTDERLW